MKRSVETLENWRVEILEFDQAAQHRSLPFPITPSLHHFIARLCNETS